MSWHFIVVLMSTDIQSEPFPYRLVFIGLFCCDFSLDASDSSNSVLFYCVPCWSLIATLFERESNKIGLLDVGL